MIKGFMSWEITSITNKTHFHNGKAPQKFWVKLGLYYLLDMVQDISEPISGEYK